MKKSLIRKTAETPAELLDQTIKTTKNISHSLESADLVKKSRAYWRKLGPGLITGASGDDPSGIATASQTGAQYGFNLLWLSVLTFPLMSIVQEMCARIGLVTGQGLAANIRTHFSRRVLYLCVLLLFIANAFNIGANLGAMAQAIQLFNSNFNSLLLVAGFTVLILGLQIFVPYQNYTKYLKYLALVLLTYIASALITNLNWNEVFWHIIKPDIAFNKDHLLLICAMLGTAVSPYLFFWQTSQEVEDKKMHEKNNFTINRSATKQQIHNMRIDVWSGMFFASLVIFFIIAACGATLFPEGITNITSAAQAAEALRPLAGDLAYFLFAVGIIGTGMLSIPILAGASSYAISESFDWHGGLSKNLKHAYAFYGIIIISMLIGLAINFIGLNPIKTLVYSAVANGIVAPLVLIPIVLISSNKEVMGKWTNRPLTTFCGWIIITAMATAGIATIISFFS